MQSTAAWVGLAREGGRKPLPTLAFAARLPRGSACNSRHVGAFQRRVALPAGPVQHRHVDAVWRHRLWHEPGGHDGAKAGILHCLFGVARPPRSPRPPSLPAAVLPLRSPAPAPLGATACAPLGAAAPAPLGAPAFAPSGTPALPLEVPADAPLLVVSPRVAQLRAQCLHHRRAGGRAARAQGALCAQRKGLPPSRAEGEGGRPP
mmetsp:Transcript_107063/g.298172  ORF Transcript_107063/g.298172 Transcript_107063/m.298172 type:complete len:205 (+) Transcript_107063:583-1197(+)